MASQLIDNIETNDMNFKHLETTKDIIISPKNEYGDPQRPDATHTWTAKVSDGTNYVGDYAVKVNATSLIVDSEDFTKLPVGNYTLEVWEQWNDPDGTKELSIYPSPQKTIPFTIYANIADQAEKEIKRIGFQDVVDQAVMNIGMNYVFKVNTIEPDQTATVVQSAADGKNYVTFNIPRGVKGDRGDQGIQGIQGVKGDPGDRGPDGKQGPKGDPGKPFSIAKVFPSKESMSGDGLDEGDFVMIASNVEDPNNADLYTWTGTEFKLIADLSGATGLQGPQGKEGPQGPKGDPGDRGPDGKQGVQGNPGVDGHTPVKGVDYWTDADKQAIKDDVTKTVGDAFAKAKADVDDLILSGLNNYFVAKMPVMNDGKNHVSVSHGQAQRFNNQGGFTGELVHPDGTDITVNALKGDVITQSFVLKTDANYNNLTFNFQTVDGDQVITAGAKQLAVNTYKIYASYTATRDTPVKVMTFWADCKGGTYVELSQPYATIM